MAKPDGGPAFPASVAEIQGIATHSGEFALAGMSLRDYFAAKAMTALIDVESTADLGQGRCTFDHSVVAREAYQIADAMLAEREK